MALTYRKSSHNQLVKIGFSALRRRADSEVLAGNPKSGLQSRPGRTRQAAVGFRGSPQSRIADLSEGNRFLMETSTLGSWATPGKAGDLFG